MRLRHYFRHRLLPRCIGFLAHALIRLIGLTCRYKIHGRESFDIADHYPTTLYFWHSRTVPVIEILRRVAPERKYLPLVSKSRDGEIMASIANSYPNGGAIRVAHDNKPLAVKQLERALKQRKGICVVTPDGPRGPLHQVKYGSISAVQNAGGRVIPLHWKGSSVWTLSTWDRMEIPQPFSTLEVWIGEPIGFSEGETPQEGALRVEKALLELAELKD